MLKKISFVAAFLLGMAVQAVFAQNPLQIYEFGEEDLNAMRDYLDAYDLSKLSDYSEYERGEIAMRDFITNYLIRGKHADRLVRIPSYSEDTYYYYVNFNGQCYSSIYEMNDNGENRHEVLRENQYISRMGQHTNEPISIKEYEQMGIKREDVRGNGYLAPMYIVSLCTQENKENYVRRNEEYQSDAYQCLRSMMLGCEQKPIELSYAIEPTLDETTPVELGKPIEFTIHALWRGFDVDKAHLNVKTNGPCHLDTDNVVTDAEGKARVNVTLDDYGLCQLYVEYTTNDYFWGPMECVCEYYFSLDEDDKWDYIIEASDKLSKPYYDYMISGTMAFRVFKYGKCKNLVYEDLVGEHNIRTGHGITKETADEDMKEVVQPVLTYHTAVMSSPNGFTEHTVTTSKVIYDDEHEEAFIAFDQDKLQTVEKESKKTGKRIFKEALGLSLGVSGDLKAESTVSPPMLMRFPLREDKIPFNFSLGDMQSLMFGLDESATAAVMSGEALDPDTAMGMLAENQTCAVIPNAMRFMQMAQLGSIFMIMMGGEDEIKESGTLSGTIKLKKVDPEAEFDEDILELEES